LTKHRSHPVDIIGRKSPIPLDLKITQTQWLLVNQLAIRMAAQASDLACNLARQELGGSEPRFVICHNPAGNSQPE
jgi:hypothetical protein